MSRTEIAIDSRRGRTALFLASCAGMADLIALSVSVSRYAADRAGSRGLGAIREDRRGQGGRSLDGLRAVSEPAHRRLRSGGTHSGGIADAKDHVVRDGGQARSAWRCRAAARALNGGHDGDGLHALLQRRGAVSPRSSCSRIRSRSACWRPWSSGRSLAATPAMTMAGAALGALVGGTLVKFFGFGGIPLAAAVLAAFAVLCFSRLPSAGALHSHKEIFE